MGKTLVLCLFLFSSVAEADVLGAIADRLIRSAVDRAVASASKPTDCRSFLYAGGARFSKAETFCRSGFAFGYDGEKRSSVWVAERLISSDLKGNVSREGIEFREDSSIPVGQRSLLGDYVRSGYDRGHLAPAGDFRNNQAAMVDSFVLSNIVPQAPENNRGIWASLEGSVRESAARRGELFVVTGPVYLGGQVARIGRTAVPDALYKVLIDPVSKTGTAFLIPNKNGLGDDFSRYQVTIRSIEKVTGIDFNPELPRAEQDRLEVDGGDWVMPKVRSAYQH